MMIEKQGRFRRRPRCWATLLVLALALVFPRPAPAQSDALIEASPQLFATMAALYAAGYDVETSGAGLHPLRLRLRAEMAPLGGPAVEALRQFYREHRAVDPAATLSRYLTLALVLGPPPAFDYSVTRDELPPDALALEGFRELLVNFHREAGIEQRWEKYRPAYEREVARLREPIGQIVVSSAGYLRELLDPNQPRRFSVIVEPGVGARTNLRNLGDRYFLVLNPGAEPPLDEIRHSFLHFLLDPLTIRYRFDVETKSSLLYFAARAPRLSAEYREDFPAFLTECVVRAVELRLRSPASAEAELTLAAADREGYVLVRPLYRELQRFERATPAMSIYFPDLVRGVRVADEARRLENLEFAPAESRAAEQAAPAAQPTSLERELEQAERLIAAKDAAGATAAFARILDRHPKNTRALYGSAVANVMLGEAEKAKDLFRWLVSPAAAGRDPGILAWSHVFLGRIHDVDGDRELALTEYRAALAVEGAPESVRMAARRGLERGYQPAARQQPGAEKP